MEKNLKVLLVEDNADDAELIIRQVRKAGFAVQWKRVETKDDFLAALQEPLDIILSDYSMPKFSGLEAAQAVQESGLNVPFILISGTVGEDLAVEAMKHGASDYLLKDRLGRLGGAIERAFQQKASRAEREGAEEEIRNQLEELRRWQECILEREDRIIDLKSEVNELLVKQGSPPRYPSLKQI